MRALLRTTIFLAATTLAAPSLAQRSAIQLGEPSKKLTEPQVKSLMACKFVYKLKAGMTNAEAGDAIDAGWNKFTSCLKQRAAREQKAN